VGVGVSVLSEAETAAPFGGLSIASTTELKQALTHARYDFINGQVSLALQSLQTLSEDVASLPPSAERWELQRSVLAQLAQVVGRSDKAAAQSILLRILAVQPDYVPTLAIFPPSFIAEVATLREAFKHLPTTELKVTTEPAATDIALGGRPMGPAPTSVSLPLGTYRLEGIWGYKGLTKMIEVGAPPGASINVLLSKAVEGSIAPDAGPCVFPIPNRDAALARVAALLKVKRIFAVRSEASGNEQTIVAEEFDSTTGSETQEKRERVVPPDTEFQVAAHLAAQMTSSAELEALQKAPAPVEATRLRTWSYVVGGIGVAALTTGLILYFNGNSTINKLNSLYAEGNNRFPPDYESTFQSRTDSAKTRKTVGVVVGGVGVAALVAGATLFFLAANGGKPSSVTIVPYFQPGGGGIFIAAQF
jgi:hypothetical protein